MDYKKIGQNVRKYRRANGFSQEELAEKVNISTTHMSHIETGSTKLSLPVFVDIAETLQVRADDLLFDYPACNPESVANEILSVLSRCNDRQTRILSDIVSATKLSLDKNS